MDESIRQNVLSAIYSLSSIENDLKIVLDNIKHQSKFVREGSRSLFAGLSEELGLGRSIGRGVGGAAITSEPDYQRFPEYVHIENRYHSEMFRVKSILANISIRTKGNKYEDGRNYEKSMEAQLLGSPLKTQVKTSIRLLKKLVQRDLVYTRDLVSKVESKPARNIQVSEQIAIAKRNFDNPEIAINHIRTAIDLLIQQKFGFEVKNLPRFVNICGEAGINLPRNLITTYDLGSKNIHKGMAPSSSDLKSAVVFVEEFEKEMRHLSINETQLSAIRLKCEKEKILFKPK